jgi:uncharacterized membrane protein
MKITRMFKQLFTPPWVVSRAFSRRTLNAIERAIGESEHTHNGELRFAVEAGLHPLSLWRGQTTRQRALEVFANLRVWDTEHNSGVLIYVQMVDRRIEIVADRGISAKVAQRDWNAICGRIEHAYRNGEFEQGTLGGIREITGLLAAHFPPRDGNANELPDRPVVV